MKSAKINTPEKTITLLPDLSMKHLIKETIVRESSALNIIRYLSRCLLVAGIIGSIAYVLFTLRLNSWMSNSAGKVMNVEIVPLVFAAVIIAALGVVAFFVLRYIVSVVSGRYISNRTNEKLTLNENELRYSYTTGSMSDNERTTVVIKLEKTKAVSYNKVFHKFSFNGYQQHYTNLGGNKTAASKNERGKFVIYDYFKPSMYQTVKQLGVNLEEG